MFEYLEESLSCVLDRLQTIDRSQKLMTLALVNVSTICPFPLVHEKNVIITLPSLSYNENRDEPDKHRNFTRAPGRRKTWNINSFLIFSFKNRKNRIKIVLGCYKNNK